MIFKGFQMRNSLSLKINEKWSFSSSPKSSVLYKSRNCLTSRKKKSDRETKFALVKSHKKLQNKQRKKKNQKKYFLNTKEHVESTFTNNP